MKLILLLGILSSSQPYFRSLSYNDLPHKAYTGIRIQHVCQLFYVRENETKIQQGGLLICEDALKSIHWHHQHEPKVKIWYKEIKSKQKAD